MTEARLLRSIVVDEAAWAPGVVVESAVSTGDVAGAGDVWAAVAVAGRRSPTQLSAAMPRASRLLRTRARGVLVETVGCADEWGLSVWVWEDMGTFAQWVDPGEHLTNLGQAAVMLVHCVGPMGKEHPVLVPGAAATVGHSMRRWGIAVASGVGDVVGDAVGEELVERDAHEVSQGGLG